MTALRWLPLMAATTLACGRAPVADPSAPDLAEGRYHLVGARGALTFADPGAAARGEVSSSGAPRLLPGFGVSIVEERLVGGRGVGRTGHRRWIALADLTLPHPLAPVGAALNSAADLNFAWVVAPDALFSRVAWPAPTRASAELRVPRLSPRPPGVGVDERWIDVSLGSQTLVAYQGDRPVFATLVSTGIGQPPSPLATPTGSFRIRGKYQRASMDNLEHTGVVPYSFEDIPLVQYFTDRVALHPAPWHQRFGHPASHGCVNVSPADARWLFAFTAPHLAPGLPQALASPSQPGTVVRVR